MTTHFRRTWLLPLTIIVLAIAGIDYYRLSPSGERGQRPVSSPGPPAPSTPPAQNHALTNARRARLRFKHSPEPESETRPDDPGEAIAFRNLQLRDENGFIPPDGLLRAKEHVDAMRSAARAAGLRRVDALAGISPTNWTWLGPGNIGGRVRSIVIDPAAPSHWFAGSVAGGVWATTNSGNSWLPLDDFMGNLAVSSLAMQPGNSNVLYAGTGEGFGNPDAIQGAGIFKTTDGGATWNLLSSTNPAATSNFLFVNRLAISANGSVLLAGTTSGIFRSTDGGASFSGVTGPGSFITQVVFHPTDSNKAVAGTSYGPAWYSTDGGVSWKSGGGLPGSGRVELAYALNNPSFVYAAVNVANGSNYGEIFKSSDGGATYSQVSFTNPQPNFFSGALGSQGWYDNAIWVDPTNSDNLLVGGINLWRSTNGGAAWTQVSEGANVPNSAHADHHAIVTLPGFDGVTNKQVVFGSDGGIYSTADVSAVGSDSNHTSGWVSQNHGLGVTQFYGVAGNASAGTLVGGTQDNGNLCYSPAKGPEGYTSLAYNIGGGDGGFTAADPNDSNYVYGEYDYAQVNRSTNAGVSWSYIDQGIADANNNSVNFISPFVLDPNNVNRMLVGALSLWQSTNVKAANPTWASIKPSTGTAISAVAIAQGNANICWVGYNNGSIFTTTNCAAATPNWTSGNPNGVALPGRMVLRVTIDPNNNQRVFLAFGGYANANLWLTTNGGGSWATVTGSGVSTSSLPQAPVRDLAISPSNSSWLYAATEVGLFASQDGGATWEVPQDGPANVSVDQLIWMGNNLVAATHGRGLYMASPSTSSSGSCSAVSTSIAPSLAVDHVFPVPRASKAQGSVLPGPTEAVTSAAQFPPGGTWSRTPRIGGETWSYSFRINDQGAGANTPATTPAVSNGSVGRTLGTLNEAAKPPPSSHGSANEPKEVATPTLPVPTAPGRSLMLRSAEEGPGIRGPATAQVSSQPQNPPLSSRNSLLAVVPLAPPGGLPTAPARRRLSGIETLPVPDERLSSVKRVDTGGPLNGTLIQGRFVRDSDPRRPSAINDDADAMYEVLLDGSHGLPAALSSLNAASKSGWVRLSLDHEAIALVRQAGLQYRRIRSQPLAGIPSAGTPVSQRSDAVPFAAHLASRAELAGAADGLPGLSAFDVKFEDIARDKQLSTLRLFLKVVHPELDQLTVWLVAGDREVVLWDGRGGTDDGGFDDDSDTDSLASGYRFGKFNWLGGSPVLSRDSESRKACKMGTCSNWARLSTCRIS